MFSTCLEDIMKKKQHRNGRAEKNIYCLRFTLFTTRSEILKQFYYFNMCILNSIRKSRYHFGFHTFYIHWFLTYIPDVTQNWIKLPLTNVFKVFNKVESSSLVCKNQGWNSLHKTIMRSRFQVRLKDSHLMHGDWSLGQSIVVMPRSELN